MAEHAHLKGEAYFSGADLVVEVISPDDTDRDLVDKRADYAELGIAEYWIVNPLDEMVTVLHLGGKQYAEHGVFSAARRRLRCCSREWMWMWTQCST